MKLILGHKILWLLIVSLAVGFLYPDSASAAEKKDKASRRAALMMQKLKQEMEQEKASMQAQFDLQKKEYEDKIKSNEELLQKTRANLSATKLKLSKLEIETTKTIAELKAKQQETQTLLGTTQKNLADLKLQYNQAQADLKFNDSQRKTLSTNLANTNVSLNTCEQKNAKLYQFSSELIKIYDKPSTYNAIMREEPFFQIKRVELENILQNHQDKLDDEKVVSRKSAY